ncbi:C40 family peptidase [Nocardia sp. NPDC051570]|uniref:C40 family peptidase n=1 Tax=Nocardia sp. NPDC051570 TaxID=3364324 RepID=UPI0037B85851
MGKHSLQRESRLPNSVKGALVFGAVAATTGAMPAIPAMAATVDIPGVGNFDVPLGDQQVNEVNQALAAHADQIKQVQQALAPQAMAPGQAAPGLPNFAPPMFQQQTAGDVALDAAKSKLGAEYVWGATGPDAFDCSGLVQWAYKQAGIKLPRTSFEMEHVGRPIALSQLAPGDIIVTSNGGHVVMYAGDGKIVQAPTSGETVSFAHLNTDDVVTARRVAA